jgi:DNA-binding NtrC family response regulator
MLDREDQRAQRVHVSTRASWSGLQRADRRPRQGPEPGLITAHTHFDRQVKEVLFVHPSLELQQTVQQVLQSIAKVDVCSTFSAAYARLGTRPPDLLVTGVRLHAHNGLHLVYVAAQRAQSTRCVVCVTDEDLCLAREVEAAGAFLVRASSLAVALKSLATAKLPRRDRRDADNVDRRRVPRGGRRYTDSWIGDPASESLS